MLLATSPGASDSTQASRLRWAALDLEAELRIDEMPALLERAIAADPAFFPAYFDYLRIAAERGADADAVRVLGSAGRRAGRMGRCLEVVSTAILGPSVGIGRQHGQWLRAAWRPDEPDRCGAYYLSVAWADPDSTSPAPTQLEHARLAVQLDPEFGPARERLVTVLAVSGKHAEALAEARRGLRADLHPLERLRLGIVLAHAYRAAGRDDAAAQVAAGLAAAVERDGRPGMRFELLDHSLRPNPAPLLEQVRLARAHGAWSREAARLHGLGQWAVERGDPAAGLRYHEREVELVERSGSARLRGMAYVRRGRALSKLGRLAEAERDLRAAVSLGTEARQPYYVMEAWHNLAHAYEGAGRWEEAAAAADEFVARAETADFAGSSGPRVVSLHDAATIRWSAGWHAAANRYFARMVRVIDAVGKEQYWAGEHYERAGELARAVRYYRAAQASDPSRALEGLVRVYTALGRPDSAEAAARRHDALSRDWTPLDTPLLPRILARQGRTDEAIRNSRAWAERQRRNGNLHGAAVAALELADLLLEADRPRDALAEAERADALARRLRLPLETARARRLAGEARSRLGPDEAALGLLREAVARAQAAGDVREVVAANTALGDALAAAGQPERTLRAYAAAAAAVEAVTGGLEADLDRVGYRDRHLAAFDGAVRVALRLPASPGNLATLAEWSTRRKAAALQLALGDGARTPRARFTLAAVQRSLDEREALLDYVVTDSAVAVLVVTDRSARLVELPIDADSLRTLVDRLRRRLLPVTGRSIDLVRARFDHAAAHALYQALLAPALPAIGSRTRLLVAPDGPLHYLPIEALVSAQPPRGPNGRLDHAAARYVLDVFEVAYLPSAAFAMVGRQAPVGSPRVLVVAGSAPAARQEAAGIAAAWPRGRVTALLGPAATETALRAATGYRILHVAAHARADGRDPLASHLLLAPDTANDGFLHLSEIGGWEPGVALVVLSACETVSGPLYQGEGPLGLARAFLLTGTAAVVATQWPVGAPNAQLMTGFHRALARGAAPAAALREARLALRRRPETAHPLFWAGPVLIGRAAE